MFSKTALIAACLMLVNSSHAQASEKRVAKTAAPLEASSNTDFSARRRHAIHRHVYRYPQRYHHRPYVAAFPFFPLWPFMGANYAYASRYGYGYGHRYGYHRSYYPGPVIGFSVGFGPGFYW